MLKVAKGSISHKHYSSRSNTNVTGTETDMAYFNNVWRDSLINHIHMSKYNTRSGPLVVIHFSSMSFLFLKKCTTNCNVFLKKCTTNCNASENGWFLHKDIFWDNFCHILTTSPLFFALRYDSILTSTPQFFVLRSGSILTSTPLF